MSKLKVGLNESALKRVKNLIDDPGRYRVSVEKSESGATIVDAGIAAPGGFIVGQAVAEIALVGYGTAGITPILYGEQTLPSVSVTSDYPALTTLHSQFSDFQEGKGDSLGIGFGPANLLSKENKTLLERIQFEEESDTAVLALETEKKPSESVVEQIAQSCSVSSENLYLIVFSKNSLAGALQASGQIVGLGMERLIQAGLDPLSVKYAWGYAPIATLHQNPTEFGERTKAAIMSSGVTSYIVDSQDESHLRKVLGQSHASALKMFLEAKSIAGQNPIYKDLLRETGMDQMSVESDAIAPAVVTLRNFRTGMTLIGGKLDLEGLKRALGML